MIMFKIDESISKIIGKKKPFLSNTPNIVAPGVVKPSGFDFPKKIANLQQVATGSVFFPFTQPTVQHPASGRVIQGRMPSMDEESEEENDENNEN